MSQNKQMKILIPIASGTEEMEAVSVIDIMVRAGYQVIVACANFDNSLTVKGSRGVQLIADCKLIDVADDEFDCIVLSGGIGGAEIFRDNIILIEMIKQHMYEGKLVAAICASPAIVLQHHNLYPKAIMTCHPNFQHAIPQDNWRTKRVTFDSNHNLITSQGPGTSLEFAIDIIIKLSGKELAWIVAEPLVTLPQLLYHKLTTE